MPVAMWLCTRVIKQSALVKHVAEGGRLQTDSDTKLLYCWMFRLRISEHGPRTRSNRGRSSFTHFNRPRATTVAARGRFINRAISPRAMGEREQCYKQGVRSHSSACCISNGCRNWTKVNSGLNVYQKECLYSYITSNWVASIKKNDTFVCYSFF